MPSNRTILYSTILFLILIIWGIFNIQLADYTRYIWPVLLGYLGLGFVRYLFFFFGLAANEIKRLRLIKDAGLDNYANQSKFTVSIIVPAYNEEQVIRDALLSLTKLNYPNYEIVVVDDGSSDLTYNEAQSVSLESAIVKISVIRKDNGGKASALNTGLQYCSGEIIMCVDADSRIHPDSLSLGTIHFKNPKVVGVAGFVEIVKKNSFLLQCQELEYVVSLNFIRSAYSFLGIVPIVPGPCGLFRRSALVSLEGYVSDKNNFAEDAELTLRLISEGGRIVSEPSMIAYTEAPETWGTLLRQRYRWNRGTFQAVKENFNNMLHSSRYEVKILGILLLAETWLIPMINLGLIIIFLGIYFRFGVGSFFTIWMLMIFAIDLLVTSVGISRSDNYMKRVLLSIASRLSYDILLLLWRFVCLFEEWSEREMTWDKLNRTGALKERK